MQDLTPSEIEALSRAMGSSFVEKVSPSKSKQKTFEKKNYIPPTSAVSHAQFSQAREESTPSDQSSLQDQLMDIKIQVDVIFGRKKMPLGNLMQLHQGSIIELNKLAGEPVDIEANGKLIAHGEVVVVENHFGVKITEFV